MAYTAFMSSSRTHDVIPWIPIDPSIILPWHRAIGRVPATFEPKGMILWLSLVISLILFIREVKDFNGHIYWQPH